jgi:hypothetical protein
MDCESDGSRGSHTPHGGPGGGRWLRARLWKAHSSRPLSWVVLPPWEKGSM